MTRQMTGTKTLLELSKHQKTNTIRLKNNRVPKSGVSRLVFQRGGTVVLIESLMNQKIRSKKGNDRYEHFTRTLS